MGRLLFALLRLLLQLTIFVLTGHWPKIARNVPTRGRAKRAVHAPQARKPARAAPASPRRAKGEAPIAFGADPYVNADVVRAALAEGGAPRRLARGVRLPEHAAGPPERGRRSLARALRDPRTLRDALILQAALGGRKAGR